MVNPVILPIEAAQAGCTATGTIIGTNSFEDEDTYFGKFQLSSTGYSYAAVAADNWEFYGWEYKYDTDGKIISGIDLHETVSSEFDGEVYSEPFSDTRYGYTDRGVIHWYELLEVKAVFKPKYGVILCNSDGVVLCDSSGQILCGGY